MHVRLRTDSAVLSKLLERRQCFCSEDQAKKRCCQRVESQPPGFTADIGLLRVLTDVKSTSRACYTTVTYFICIKQEGDVQLRMKRGLPSWTCLHQVSAWLPDK